MWANYYSSGLALHPSKASAINGSEKTARPEALPVAVIPLDDIETLIVAAAAAHYKAWSGIGKPTNGDCMRAALTAIGLLPKQRKGRK
jgi:hypothetical protein